MAHHHDSHPDHAHAHAGHRTGTAHSPHHGHESSQRALTVALVLTFGFAGVEAVAGWIAGSLALISDAGHMLTDSLALLLAGVAAWVARKPPSARMSYGYSRVEVLAALFNAGFMFAVIILIGWNAVQRLQAPLPVDGTTVIWIGAMGLAVNLLVAWILSRGGDHGHDLNTRGALLHVMGDALGSLAALIAGLVIRNTGWTPIDPLLSFGICGLIALSTWRLAREAIHTLMEGVPQGLSSPDVGRRMAMVAGIVDVHDLHIWSMDARHAALSAHITLIDMSAWPRIMHELRELLALEFNIDHATLQPETVPVATVALSEVRRRDRAV